MLRILGRPMRRPRRRRGGRYHDAARAIALVQGAYYLVSGIWPWLHMRSFVRVTGPKTDLWLVQTVGALIVVTGAVLARAAAVRRVAPEVMLLGAGSAAALAFVDGHFVARGVISRIYLADAAAELALAGAWALAAAAE